MSKAVTIIDYGVGNMLSVARAFEHCGATVILAHDPAAIERAESLVLPGVGAFENGMRELRERGLIAPIRRYATSGRPLLGICLGMQMLASVGEEFGEYEGLNLIPGRVKQLPRCGTDGLALKSPNIGWCDLLPSPGSDWSSGILANSANASVYLVHSYALYPDQEEHRLADCTFGGHRFASAVKRGNVFGCQFHPEKSGPEGLKIISSFLELTEPSPAVAS